MTGIQAIPRTKGNTFIQLSTRKLTLRGRSRKEFLFYFRNDNATYLLISRSPICMLKMIDH